ncbi:MAG: hypothetical protein IJ253_02390 [Bacteroidaceae bacterium]|nr:hypothetical protein [Bacteroidaceae bacterium]
MSLPVNIDKYSEYLPIDSEQLRRDLVPEDTIQRVERLRELSAYWRSYPSTSAKELVTRCEQMFRVGKSQAYDDIHILKILIGNLEATTKEFARWRVNQMIEEDRLAARRDGDWRAVASMQKNYILNNQTDKEDTPDKAFERIVPLVLEPTDDPSVLGIKAPKNLRQLRDKLIRRFTRDSEFDDYEDVTEEKTK